MPQLGFLAVLLAATRGHDERLLDEDGHYHHRGCATEAYNEAQLAENPAWANSLDAFETSWKETQSAIQSGQYKQEQMSITIPIVFHIVSQNPNNVPDSAIAYQLERLQQDYSATNSDYTSGTPTEFQSVRSGDTQIRFYTQSTLRVVTSVSSFSSNDNIKRTSAGGSDVVSPESNLNFWAGTLSGGLLGYAQFPGGPSSTDGVVQATGTLSPEIGSPPYNLGRTATHEVGHWLNLRHIWGDNSGCTNTALISDFVTDTPPSSSSNFGCPSGVKRCSANPYSQDMYMNFMDYVEDSCMVMFTQLQNARAQASIAQYRGGFQNVPESAKSFVNWLYFTRFEGDVEPTDDEKCVGDHELFYEGDLNAGSASSVRIYGCLTRTNKVNVGHMTTVYMTEDECEEGHFRASQDLNEGNAGSVFMCYDKVESNDANNNMAVLDLSFVAGEGVEEDEGAVAVNPSGLSLRLQVETGSYLKFEGRRKVNEAVGEDGGNGGGAWAFRFVVLAAVILVMGVIVVVSWKLRKGSLSRQKVEDMSKALAEDGVEYGATVEMSTTKV